MKELWIEIRLLICNYLLYLIIFVAPKNIEGGRLIDNIKNYVKNKLEYNKLIKRRKYNEKRKKYI